MHYYQHNIKTFNSATRFLTRVERSLYRDLIELYYDTEQPLVSDKERLQRLVIANSEEEKNALDFVLSEFFTLEDDGFHHEYCDLEIEKYKKQHEAKSLAGKASAAKRKQPLKRSPSKKNSSSTGVQQSFNECSTNQEPITNNQEPKEKANAQNAVAFDAFWTAYPKKKDRKKSEQAWVKLKLTDEQAGEILKKLAQQVMQPSWLKDDGQYIPYPTTYLNGRRWEDDLEPVVQTASAKNQLAPNVVPMSKADREAYDLIKEITGGGRV
jgi:uncharacterized protein YdaU (DUF1376 family)